MMGAMSSHAEQAPVAITVVKDPVCGMDVDPAVSRFRSEHAGQTYFFCSGHCQARFDANPLAYVAAAGRDHGHPEHDGQDHHEHAHHEHAHHEHAHHEQAHHDHGDGHTHHQPPAPTPSPAAGAEVAEWTCPMHPEIRRPGPGSCPICGMALEPVMVTADSGPSPELADMRRRFWTGVALSVPVVGLGMGGELVPAIHDVISPRASAWAQLVLATPVVVWAGWPFFQRGWTSVRTLKLNMFTLIAMGTGVAWLFSVVATVAPDIFPDAFRMDGAVDVYFEAASVITTLVLLGQVLELQARERTSGAIRALLDLTPDTARRISPDGTEEEVTLDLVSVGDRFRVRPGEKVPVDGVVEDGRSTLDETQRRREKQIAYNREAGVDPQPLRKKIADITDLLQREDADTEALMGSGRSQSRGKGGGRGGRGALQADAGVASDRLKDLPANDLANLIQELSAQMHQAAADLHFELAARLRDEIGDLKKELRQMSQATK
jgi:Cu+-exporting ATPase